MIKIKFFLYALVFLNSIACSQPIGPGYDFDIFKGSPAWKLAKAVEKEDSNGIKMIIRENVNIINFKDAVFGNSVLHLACINNKAKSVAVLLEAGADPAITDNEGQQPIHILRWSGKNENKKLILKSLVEYNADVTVPFIKKKGEDTIYFYVPLMGVSNDLECGRFLIENGADLYVKFHNRYPVWMFAGDIGETDETIKFIRYLVMERKFSVPDTISFTIPDKNPINFEEILLSLNLNGNSEKEKMRTEILEFIRK